LKASPGGNKGNALFAEMIFTCGKLGQAAGEANAEPLTADNAVANIVIASAIRSI
jgi:hypothetical protein